MSWLRCDSCDALIDTDIEPEAYVEQRDVWLCADCRGPELIMDPAEEEAVEREMIARQERAFRWKQSGKDWGPLRSPGGFVK